MKESLAHTAHDCKYSVVFVPNFGKSHLRTASTGSWPKYTSIAAIAKGWAFWKGSIDRHPFCCCLSRPSMQSRPLSCGVYKGKERDDDRVSTNGTCQRS